MSAAPRVTFAVPCYGLAHFLPECLASIFEQTFADFEVIVLDDASPDDTPAVVAAIRDPRVRYTRNETNLGPAKNFNKGLAMARGEYVWIISADDRLRRPYVLERFVATLDRSPRIGYVFCPIVRLIDGRESGVEGVPTEGGHDFVRRGREFLGWDLVYGNVVPAPATLVRRDCYERFGTYPLDMPHASDWYLWSVFAASTDVAYLAEPMVHYRLHGENLHTTGARKNPRLMIDDDMRALWRTLARVRGDRWLTRRCRHGIALDLARRVWRREEEGWALGLEPAEAEAIVAAHAADEAERRLISAWIAASLAHHRLRRRRVPGALSALGRALRRDPMHLPEWAGCVASRALRWRRHRGARRPVLSAGS